MKNRFRYYKEKNMSGLVMILLLVLNLAIVVVGCFILRILPENRQLSLGDAFWESLRLILDPGGFLGTKLSAVTTVVTSIIVLCGTITFTGGVIGYVTNIITSTIENSKNGSKEIALTQFTLILNWNERAMAIILDYVHDARRDNKNEYIVILSEQDKSTLEQLIAKEIKAYKDNNPTCNKYAPKIVVRQGNPRYTADLQSVNYTEAKAIYVMQIEGDETPDFEVMQTCMAISAANGFMNSVVEYIDDTSAYSGEYETRIVAETSSEKTAKMLSELKVLPIVIGKAKQTFPISPIRNDMTLGKLFAQIAINPSMSKIFQEVLSQAGSEFVEYDLEGNEKSFEDELRELRCAIPIYDSQNNGRVYLSGDSSAESANFEYLDKSDIRIEGNEMIINPLYEEKDGLVVIWGYNKKLKFILNSIVANNGDETSKKISVLLMASKSQEEEINVVYQMEEYQGLFVSSPLIAKDGYSIEYLIERMPDNITSLLVLSRDDFVNDEKDKEVFEVWMAIHHEMKRNKCANNKLEGKIIIEVSNSNNANLLKLNAEDQIIISSEMSSLFMVQMAVGSTLQEILLDMICASGDADLLGESNLQKDEYDLRMMTAKEFLNVNESMVFLSKQDFISKVYYGTNKEYIPIGVVADKTAYLFTNGGKAAMGLVGTGDIPCLNDGYLINSDGDDLYCGNEDFDYKNGLLIEPDFEIVVVHRTGGKVVNAS